MALGTSRTRLAFVLLAVLLIAAAADAYYLHQLTQWNDLIRSGDAGKLTGSARAEVRFAQASALATSGDEQTALTRYRELQSDPRLAQAARYNGANLLVRQATAMQNSATPGQAIPLLELAKETYREVLRADPGQWDAKYNLERAQRLFPDPEDDEPTAMEAPRGAERAATTMRGFSPGLP